MQACLTKEMLAILKVIREQGGTDCTGSCHHRQPGEFHCHTVAQILRISSSSIKKYILELVNLGLLERQRLSRTGNTPVTRFRLTPLGERVLRAANQARQEEAGYESSAP